MLNLIKPKYLQIGQNNIFYVLIYEALRGKNINSSVVRFAAILIIKNYLKLSRCSDSLGLSHIRPTGGSEGSRLTLGESRQSFQVWTELEQQFGNVLVVQRQHGAAQLVAAGCPVDPFLFGLFLKLH